jgi:hypothetical protein
MKSTRNKYKLFNMKRLLIVISLISAFLLSTLSYAQQKEPSAVFEKNEYDYGKIKESDGPATYKFAVSNLGGSPLILKNVQASCGCTTPSYSKEPIMPGAKGYIAVSYNPQNRPGKFEKTITVTTNGDPETVTLKIKGEVLPKPPSPEDAYPVSIEGLRFKTGQIAFNSIGNDQQQTQTAEVINGTDAPMKVSFADVPGYMKIKITPQIINPKEKAIIEVVYDAKAKNDWGFVFDRVSLVINEKTNQGSKLSISANIQDNFENMTEEQKKNAPLIEFENTTYEFGTITQGAKAEHNYVYKNTGKSDLIIHKATASCGCTQPVIKTKILKPEETGSISVTFNSAGRTGQQNKTITVITNDPMNPKMVLWLKGNVEKPATETTAPDKK